MFKKIGFIVLLIVITGMAGVAIMALDSMLNLFMNPTPSIGSAGRIK